MLVHVVFDNKLVDDMKIKTTAVAYNQETLMELY